MGRDRAGLTAPDRPKVAWGGEAAPPPASGMTLALVAPADAKLPTPPERAPKEGTFAGFASIKTAPKAGLYTVSLSSGGWVDVVQDGHFLKATPSSAATYSARPRHPITTELSPTPPCT